MIWRTGAALVVVAAGFQVCAWAAPETPLPRNPVVASVVRSRSENALPLGGAALPPPEVASVAPLTGAVPQPKLSCAEGLKAFPFLKAWVAKLDNFSAPVDVGNDEGSLVYAMGATSVHKGVASAWSKDTVVIPIEWNGHAGNLETAWLGAPPDKAAEPMVKAGPGDARAIMLEARSGDPARAGRWSRFWSLLYSPAEIGLLSACTTQDCKIKLSRAELKAVAGSDGQYRLMKFAQALDARLDDFQKRGYVHAYEGRDLPLGWLDTRLGSVFPSPLATHFWLPQDRAQFGYDFLDPAPGFYKPIVGVYSRSCEKRGPDTAAYTACADLVVYNNHYFDFWGRLVLFFPWCDAEVALAYEMADVDQMKESRIARVLFAGEIRDLLGRLLEVRLKRLHVLGI